MWLALLGRYNSPVVLDQFIRQGTVHACQRSGSNRNRGIRESCPTKKHFDSPLDIHGRRSSVRRALCFIDEDCPCNLFVLTTFDAKADDAPRHDNESFPSEWTL